MGGVMERTLKEELLIEAASEEGGAENQEREFHGAAVALQPRFQVGDVTGTHLRWEPKITWHTQEVEGSPRHSESAPLPVQL